ncbi:MAG TPA: Crp/Fnr family transcriptional regulator [Gemmatimonadaceae bacterium]|nr:Crp/Fnr family transcriptional regulator [Gemmatimonadaceae bacterium]
MISVERLVALPLFAGERREVVDALARRGIEARFEPNAVMFLAGSEPRGWYIVLEGRVRVVRGSGSRQHVVHTEGKGGTLGEVPLFAGGTHPATGIAAEPTRCALFSRAALEAAIGEAPAIAFIIARRLALRVRQLVDRLDERSARSVQARLIEFLLSRPTNGWASITLGMTQQALAEELGTVREVVSREIRVLTRRGWIEALGGGRYRLLAVDQLRAASA